jgi:uncharacterized protein (UPF0332 family)
MAGKQMDTSLEKKIEFRLQQSEEKLKLSSLMINKGQFNDSIIFSYLSLFYSVRVLLIRHDEDSDDYSRIHDLMEKYYQPTGWTNLNIVEIIRETREFKDLVESNTGNKATKNDAVKFNKNASDVLEQVRQQSQLLSDTHTAPSE